MSDGRRIALAMFELSPEAIQDFVLDPVGFGARGHFLSDDHLGRESGELGEVAHTLGASMSPSPWGVYAAVDETRCLVGLAGFKGVPDREGIVEIAYFTREHARARGMATNMALALLKIALEYPGLVRVVRAHTLREPNASTQVLRKAGFTFMGNAQVPEDGLVWRWELPTVGLREPPSSRS